MDNEKPHILIVDDSPNDIHLLLNELSDYQVTAATSGEMALERLSKGELPDLILLDINMPGLDGYEVCKTIKNTPEYKRIQIIFLSANDSTEEIMRGVESGAIDYIVKPFNPELLHTKIKHISSMSKSAESFRTQAEEASKVAQTFMSESSSLSLIVSFHRAAFRSSSFEELHQATIDAFKNNGLSVLIYFKSDEYRELLASEGLPSMLETELMSRLWGAPGPFLEKNGRLFIIQKDVVAFIKNIPDNQEKLGTIKDFSMIVLEGAHEKLTHLDNLARLQKQSDDCVSDAVRRSNQILKDIRRKQDAHKKLSMDLLQTIAHKVQEALYTMALNEKEEEALLNLVTESVSNALDHVESGFTIDDRMYEVIDLLTSAMTGGSAE